LKVRIASGLTRQRLQVGNVDAAGMVSPPSSSTERCCDHEIHHLAFVEVPLQSS
jgi:hypothetical protein